MTTQSSNGFDIPVKDNAHTFNRAIAGKWHRRQTRTTLSYDRSDPHSDTIFQRFRDGRITKTEAIAGVDEW